MIGTASVDICLKRRCYMDDAALLAEHGAGARTRCEQRFDIRRCAAGYAGLFQSRRVGRGKPRRCRDGLRRNPEPEEGSLS
jgi:hypothetical protein